MLEETEGLCLRSLYNSKWNVIKHIIPILAYTYNEQGVRTSKTVNSVVTNFSYNGSLLMAQVTGSGAGQVKQLYSYDASGQLVSVNYNGTEYFYMRNGQNDIVGLMDNSGAVVVSYSYDSWGKSLTVSGTLATTLGANNPFRYRGYYYDTETGLYYLQTRYYDAEVGRFISADVYFATGQGLVGNNTYAYCLNNPINNADDSGMLTLPNWAKVAIGVVAIGIGVAAAVATGGLAVAIPVLIASVQVAAVSAAVGAATGGVVSAIVHRVTTGSWNGVGKAALKGVVDGAADGFMTGGIFAGATQVLSAGFRVAATWVLKQGEKQVLK